MPIRLSDLIERVPKATEGKVKQTRDRTRSIVQEALRSECRLSLRTPAEMKENRAGGQVPVEIAPGYPELLERIEFPDDYEMKLLIARYQKAIENSVHGTSGLMDLHEALAKREQIGWVKVTQDQMKATHEWALELQKILADFDPLQRILSLNEDILGAYFYDVRDFYADEQSVNKASIQLYWGVIGLVSEWLGCTVEDLTIVVLAHELAHAYTQLGADIEGRRWRAVDFSNAEKGLKEGLAQYYTDRVLNRLAGRYPGALEAYEKMLPGQPAAYQQHRPWIEDASPEAVRRATLEVRRWREGKLDDFNKRLADAQRGLSPAG